MNLIRQREDLKAACKAGAIPSRQLLEEALNSPVFQWWSETHKGKTLSSDELEFIKANLMEEVSIKRNDGKDGLALWPILTPYPCFRVSQMEQEVWEQWWVSKDEYSILHCEIHPERKQKVWTVSRKRRSEMNGWGFAMWIDEDYADLYRGDLMSPNGNEKISMRVGNTIYDINRKQLSEFSGDCVRRLAWFLFDIYGAGHTVVKVGPKPDPTKSVQWRMAREHYVVLRRQQVEKLRESKGHITDEELIRAAHWRRAHLRRLSAGRFINKRGLLVPVKRAWVGPTEWEGKDGKIYTVVGIEPPRLTGVS